MFPAIRPKEGSAVNGLLMPGLSAREKVKLWPQDDVPLEHIWYPLHALGVFQSAGVVRAASLTAVRNTLSDEDATFLSRRIVSE